jgi:hypothetical protein
VRLTWRKSPHPKGLAVYLVLAGAITLNTTVAGMGAILRLPFRLLTAPIRFLFHVHWLLGFAALLLFCRMLLLWVSQISSTWMNSTRAGPWASETPLKASRRDESVVHASGCEP